LFMGPKHYGLIGEEYIHKKGVWFYAVVSILLTLLIWYSIPVNAVIAFGAALGSSLFFITHGFRQNAEEREKQMLSAQKMSDWSKILYLNHRRIFLNRRCSRRIRVYPLRAANSDRNRD